MKRLISGIIVCILLSGIFVSPEGNAVPKSLKQAEKLSGNFEKLEEARTKVSEALQDTTLSSDPHALYIAGKIEEGAFRHYHKLLGINQNDPKVDRTLMADALLAAVDYYERALAVDTITDKKGKRTIRYSVKIAEWLHNALSI